MGDKIRLHGGILMPFYPATVDQLPSPILPQYALRVLERMTATLSFVHDNSWMQGDVKPSNIFLDAEGEAWLGDYGSSVYYGPVEGAVEKTGGLAGYAGGTPALQCMTISYATKPRQFDLAGLLLTLLVKLDALDVKAGAVPSGWHPAAINSAIDEKVKETRLREALTALWAEIQA
jgi:serine/threonine protein kinase